MKTYIFFYNFAFMLCSKINGWIFFFSSSLDTHNILRTQLLNDDYFSIIYTKTDTHTDTYRNTDANAHTCTDCDYSCTLAPIHWHWAIT